jgi:hypothetical protein
VHVHCYHEQDSGKARYLLSEQVAFHRPYLALARVPIASMPCSRSTMHRPRYRLRGTLSLGGFCRWRGGFEVPAMISMSGHGLGLVQRDLPKVFGNKSFLIASHLG